MKPTSDTVRALIAWSQVLDELLAFERSVANEPGAHDPLTAVHRVEDAVARATTLVIPPDDDSHTAEALRLVLVDVHRAMDGLRTLSSQGDSVR